MKYIIETFFLIIPFTLLVFKCGDINLKELSVRNSGESSYLTVQLFDNSSKDYDSLQIRSFCFSLQGKASCLIDFKEGILEVDPVGIKIPLPPGKYEGSLRLRGGAWENIKANISFDSIGKVSGGNCSSEETIVGYSAYQNIVCPTVLIAPGRSSIIKIEISPIYKSYLEESFFLFFFFQTPSQTNLRFLNVSII